MGCKCAHGEEEKDEVDKEENEDNNEKNNSNPNLLGLENENQNDKQNGTNNYTKYSDYPEKIIQIINNIREDPKSYADIVEDSIKYIIEEDNRLIFKKKVKVALNRGEPAFNEAAEILRNCEPLPPLLYKNELKIPLPDTIEELRDPKFLRSQVRQMREDVNIDVFFKDLIKIPEVAALLMIVDDYEKNAGKKRMTLLDRELKYIGVNFKFIEKTFIAYFAFSK